MNTNPRNVMEKTSKSKTFNQQSEIAGLIDWVVEQVETTDREVIQVTPPDYDVRVELNHKYIITITKVKDKQ